MKVTNISLRSSKSFFTLLVVCLFFASSLSAQEKEQAFPQDIFVEVSCFEGLQPGFASMMVKMAKPFHEEMIRQGILVDWSFHRVDYPNGDDCECDFREVRVFRDMASLDKLNSNEVAMGIANKLWPDMDMEATMAEFREKGKFKNSRIYHVMDAAAPNPTDGKMAVMNFMDVKPGEGEKYVKMEKEVFKPVHQEGMKTGKMKDWIMMETVLPYGTDFPTDFITVDVYDSYADMASNNMMANFEKAHPGKDAWALMNEMDKVRSLTHSEILVLISEAEMETKPAPETTTAKDKK